MSPAHGSIRRSPFRDRTIAIAVPVCSASAMELLHDFGQVTDEEVLDALAGPARVAA